MLGERAATADEDSYNTIEQVRQLSLPSLWGHSLTAALGMYERNLPCGGDSFFKSGWQVVQALGLLS